MSAALGHLADDLRQVLQAEVLWPGDDGYERHRLVWNGSIDRHPTVIVRPGGTPDIADRDTAMAVRAAVAGGLPVAIRGGGHNVAGLGTCDQGLLVDLSRLRSVHVDAHKRIALVGGGATWADVDAATARHGLATTGGQVSTTGVGGLTLGGGLGWLARRYGLACDNLRAASLVDASGAVSTVDADQDPDLFWALRGGGGNFGVVTRLSLALHPVQTVIGGVLLYPLHRGRRMLQTFRDLVPVVPDGFTMSVGYWTPPGGEPHAGVALCHVGPPAEAVEALAALRGCGPTYDDVAPVSYPALQQVFDEGSPAGQRNAGKGEFLTALPDAAIDALVEEGAQLPTSLSQILITHLGGAIARVPAESTAFGHRGATYVLNALALWSDPALDDALRDWTRQIRERVLPWSAGGAYVNFLEDEGADRVSQAYAPAVHSRLVDIKTRVDPQNVFRVNQNIRPRAWASG